MNIKAMAMRVADGILETDALVLISNANYVGTDFNAKVTKKSVKTRGTDYEFDVILHFDRGVYTEDFAVKNFMKDTGAEGEKAVVAAFDRFVDEAKNRYKRELKQHLEDKAFGERGLETILGWHKADDFDDIKAKVKGISFGKAQIGRWGVEVPVKAHVVYTATKLPDMTKGPYDRMSDRNLKELIKEWANDAPENFWMDGEYRGSATARIRQLVQQWRGMNPRQQQKHYDDLQSWRRH